MAFVTLIVPERILTRRGIRSICFHPSLLPRHRGASAINWTLIMGDAHARVTWFWPDRGIDTGPILLQRSEPIRRRHRRIAYFNRLFPLGIETMGRRSTSSRRAARTAIAQDESRATYEPPCRDEHARIDPTRSAREVFNLVPRMRSAAGAYAGGGQRATAAYEPILENRAVKVASVSVVQI